MSLRLPLSGYLLALSSLKIADGMPDTAASFGGMVVGVLLALTVILDGLYFDRRP